MKNALRAYSLKLLPCEALVVELEKRARGEKSPSLTTTNLSAIHKNQSALNFSNALPSPPHTRCDQGGRELGQTLRTGECQRLQSRYIPAKRCNEFFMPNRHQHPLTAPAFLNFLPE